MIQYEHHKSVSSWRVTDITDIKTHMIHLWCLTHSDWTAKDVANKLAALKLPKRGCRKLRLVLYNQTVWLEAERFGDEIYIKGHSRQKREPKVVRTWEDVHRDITLGGLRS
jgi:hypothetical protein